MLSKEEIEKAKEKLKEISIETELDFVHKNIEIILEVPYEGTYYYRYRSGFR